MLAVELASQVSHLWDFMNRLGHISATEATEGTLIVKKTPTSPQKTVWFCFKRKTARCLSTNRESSSCGRISD